MRVRSEAILPYHPVMMVKVLVYAYCAGVPSSRRIEKRLHEDIAFRVLAANNTPDFRHHLRLPQGAPGSSRTPAEKYPDLGCPDILGKRF